MLVLAGLALLALAAFVFRWTVLHGRYRRYPYEQFFLVGASVLVGLQAFFLRPGWLSGAALVVEAAAFATLTWYMARGARFRRGHVSLAIGERFPDFRLPQSTGGEFDSASLEGQTALFLFYRGHW